MKNRKTTIFSGPLGTRLGYDTFSAAVAIYFVTAIYLYHPYIQQFRPIQFVIPANCLIAAMGCFVLSRRWVNSFWACLYAGAIYGFCPFSLSFGAYHPLAGTVAAMMPWLFYPVVYFRAGLRKTVVEKVISIALALFPFAAVVLFFVVLRFRGGFPLPVSARMEIANISALVMPLTTDGHEFVISVYHVGIIVSLMGLLMRAMIHQVGISVVVGVGVALAFSVPVFVVSPAVWGAIPMLYLSIVAGLGMQAMAWSGRAEAKWLLLSVAAAMVVAGVLFMVSVFMVGVGGDETMIVRETSKMYLLAAVMVGCMFFVTRAGVQNRALRWAILCVGLGIDILLSARYFVDKVL